jgi:hypothetical protein
VSTVAIYSIYCNGCGVFHRAPGRDAESAKEMRADAKSIGWLTNVRAEHVKGDFCPVCALDVRRKMRPGYIPPAQS